jgi:hypothetical protein
VIFVFLPRGHHHLGTNNIFLLDLIGLFWKEQSGFERKAWNWDLPNKSQKQPKPKWATSDVFPEGDAPVESLSFFMS